MFGLGEVRVYVLDDLLRRLGKDCEVCICGPTKRRFLTNEYCKCVERAEKLVHSTVPDENYIHNPEKLDKWLIRRNSSSSCDSLGSDQRAFLKGVADKSKQGEI